MAELCGNAEIVLSAYAPPPLWNVEIVCAYDTTPDDRPHKRIKRFPCNTVSCIHLCGRAHGVTLPVPLFLCRLERLSLLFAAQSGPAWAVFPVLLSFILTICLSADIKYNTINARKRQLYIDEYSVNILYLVSFRFCRR